MYNNDNSVLISIFDIEFPTFLPAHFRIILHDHKETDSFYCEMKKSTNVGGRVEGGARSNDQGENFADEVRIRGFEGASDFDAFGVGVEGISAV